MKGDFLQAIMGNISIGTFFAYLLWAFVGHILYLLRGAADRDKFSTDSPVAFSWSYLFKDNAWKSLQYLLLNGLIAIVAIRFAPEVLHTDISPWVAVLIGFTLPILVDKFQKGTLFNFGRVGLTNEEVIPDAPIKEDDHNDTGLTEKQIDFKDPQGTLEASAETIDTAKAIQNVEDITGVKTQETASITEVPVKEAEPPVVAESPEAVAPEPVAEEPAAEEIKATPEPETDNVVQMNKPATILRKPMPNEIQTFSQTVAWFQAPFSGSMQQRVPNQNEINAYANTEIEFPNP
jgi:hypothetical protein